MGENRSIIVAMTGASGAIYGVKALEILKSVDNVITHLIVTPDGVRTLYLEMGMGLTDLKPIADFYHSDKDTGASIASGSFPIDAMLVAPCSIKSLSAIANSYDTNLVTRSADVCLKEKRTVVLMLRETPFHAGHIRLMAQADRNGAIVMPPIPEFYTKPQTINEIVVQSVCRALVLCGIESSQMKRWS